MKCINCNNKKELKKQKTKLKYDECGLDNVTLDGVDIHSCTECGEVYFNYGNIHQLHQLIKESLLKKEALLNGSEIKFLRKNMGYSTNFFAHLLGVDKRTVQRWENNEHITLQIDRAIRLSVASKESDRNYDLHDSILNQEKMKSYKRMTIDLFSKKPTVTFA